MKLNKKTTLGKEKNLDIQIETEIKELLRNVFNFYKTKDVEGLVSLWNVNSDPILIGTAEDEIRYGIHEIKNMNEREFSEMDNEVTLDYKIHKISSRGSIAWCFFLWFLEVKTIESKIQFNIRNTMICEKINGKWLLNHWHASRSDPETETGRAFPTLKGVEETILQWIDNFDLNLNFIHMKQKTQLKTYFLEARELIRSERKG
ncbi:MAG: YybH family protein [Candidatus Hodarchaeales archaeon]|jgi:ketosteroid isomerase-like protein